MKSLTALGALVFSLAVGPYGAASRGVPEALAQQSARIDSFRALKAYPHDSAAYTQGLIYRDGFLFESTGLNGQSTLRKVRLETGEVVQQRRLERTYFEGLEEWNGQLVQLT